MFLVVTLKWVSCGLASHPRSGTATSSPCYRNHSLRAGSLSVLFARVSWAWKSASEASWREEWGEEK